MSEHSGTGNRMTRMDNRHLAPITVVAQCLDNQWVTQDLLAQLVARRQSYADVERRRRSDAGADRLGRLVA